VKAFAAPEPAAAVTEQPLDAAPKPFLATAMAPAPVQPKPIVRQVQDNSDAPPAPEKKSTGPSEEQARMMNDQLYAPARIQMPAPHAEQAPPPPGGFAAASLDGSGNNNAIGNVFAGTKQPEVQVASPKVVKVSPGVAFGLLIQKTPPVYPRVAKDSQVSGTVVLLAHISKSGTIEDLHVVSGPQMLQQAAVSAVRTWRFKPYLIKNQPTEIETTINVTFSLSD
jgi:periplasmic protein TonB